MVYACPCFSGECGFCALCCDQEHASPKVDAVLRAEDLSKFLGKKRIAEMTLDYNREMDTWCKTRGYMNPKSKGRCPGLFFTLEGIHPHTTNVQFDLIRSVHSSICSDPMCMVMFINSPDHLHKKYYPLIPLYAKVGTPLKLCALCIRKRGWTM